MSLSSRLRAFFVSIALLGTASATLFADDHFSLSVGTHGDLLVFGPNGEKVGDFTAPAIAQPISINEGPSFQVSYGRDMNNMLSAIISPDPAHPADLHFSVMNKKVDSDKQAVVTLTFSSALNHVIIDPGYVGLVQVDSKTVHHHESRKSATAAVPQPPPAATPSADTLPAPAAADASSPAPDAAPITAHAKPSTVNTEVVPRDMPPAAENNPGPSVAGTTDVSSNSTAIAQPVSGGQPASTLPKRRLFWAEPVTGPNAAIPHVASNEMKLVAVHGTVSVTMPDGSTKKGVNGALVPSGATVKTSDKSSAAIFMGGVDSARLVPNSGIQVTQGMEGTVRHTTIDLKQGGVFSRVGHRPGETQKYEVRTPEGVAAARGTEYLDFIFIDSEGHHHHVVFVNKGTVDLYVDGHLVGTVDGHSGKIGRDSMGEPKISKEELDKILSQVLTEIQPYNMTTIQALFDYENGQATAGEIALIQDELYGETPSDTGDFSPEDQQFLATVSASLHDLLNPATDQVNAFQVDADEGVSGRGNVIQPPR